MAKGRGQKAKMKGSRQWAVGSRKGKGFAARRLWPFNIPLLRCAQEFLLTN